MILISNSTLVRYQQTINFPLSQYIFVVYYMGQTFRHKAFGIIIYICSATEL